MPLRAGVGCAAPPSSTAAKTFSILPNPPSDGRSVDLSPRCAKHERKHVHLIDKQESALFPVPWKFIGAAGNHSYGHARFRLFASDRSRSTKFLLAARVRPTEPRIAIPVEYRENEHFILLLRISKSQVSRDASPLPKEGPRSS
jgi:hypothetical protein